MVINGGEAMVTSAGTKVGGEDGSTCAGEGEIIIPFEVFPEFFWEFPE